MMLCRSGSVLYASSWRTSLTPGRWPEITHMLVVIYRRFGTVGPIFKCKAAGHPEERSPLLVVCWLKSPA
jgi:hypothetical protein